MTTPPPSPQAAPGPRILAMTTAAMLAFAANSILCRLALAEGAIDPASFTLIRLVAGAGVLLLILALRRGPGRVAGSWSGAAALFVYAGAFSYAYLSLAAGTGAMLLFGAVQVTMVTAGLVKGERLSQLQGLGFAMAVAGLAALLLPGAAAPALGGAMLMLASGGAWGVYSLLGRGAVDPLATTAGNFLRAAPMAVALLSVAGFTSLKLDPEAVLYAVLSGAVASGVGYAIWYAALRGLTQVQGASVQLSVPVLTALLGGVVLDEALSLRLGLCAVAILGGISLLIWPKPQRRPR